MELPTLQITQLGERRVSDDLLDAAAELGARLGGGRPSEILGRPMSQENVEEVAYEAYAAFARQDWAAYMVHFHDDAEVREEPGSVPDPSVYQGCAAIERYYRDYFRMFEHPSAELVEVRVAGDKTVLSLRFRGRARRSGIEVNAPFAQVGTWRDGRLTLVQHFRTPEEALEAVGLRE
jgi:ketosteroid isomerase-like protein